MFLLSGCKPADVGSPEAHEDEPRTAQVTVWTDRFEAFVEHRMAVAGQPVRFITHVTRLDDFAPRDAGPVRFLLRRDGEAEVEHTEPEPARPGIYTPSLVFPSAGEWQASIAIPLEAGEEIVGLPPVQVHASEADAHAAALALPEPPAGVTFLKEQQWMLRIAVEPAREATLTARRRVPAFVSALPGARAGVTPPLAGRLLVAPGKALPALGERVEAGQVVAVVQPAISELSVRIVEADAEVVRAKLALDLAELGHARIERLARDTFKSARELEEAEFAVRAARARHDAALAVRESYRKSGAVLAPGVAGETGNGPPAFELRAPIAGLVIDVAAAAGEHVSAEHPVMTILASDRVLIEARVPEADLEAVGTGGDALYEAPGSPGKLVPILGPGGGRLVLPGLEVEHETRTAAIVYEVPNPEGRLRIGMSLAVELETARRADALAIPASAVVEESGQPVAFVQVSGETFEKRHLALGVRDAGRVEVVSGLSPGDRVVTRGGYAIRLAAASAILPAYGHAH
jgi:multidrug efflux pump subunit AcrA (membrane-fusion protein)